MVSWRPGKPEASDRDAPGKQRGELGIGLGDLIPDRPADKLERRVVGRRSFGRLGYMVEAKAGRLVHFVRRVAGMHTVEAESHPRASRHDRANAAPARRAAASPSARTEYRQSCATNASSAGVQ